MEKTDKKAYARPRLIEYGSVAQLTQSGGSDIKPGFRIDAGQPKV
jgi:hypothetical protein